MSISSKNIVTQKNFLYLQKLCLTTARKMCPVDTGNMRDNGIYIKQTNTGFQVIWDNQFAYYMPIVDKGIVMNLSDLGFEEPEYNTSMKKGTKRQNLGFVNRTIIELMDICRDYVQSPKDVYKKYANRKIDFNPTMITKKEIIDQEVESLIEQNELGKMRKMLRNLNDDPVFRKFMMSQEIYKKQEELEK